MGGIFLSKLAGVLYFLSGFLLVFYFPGKTGGVIPGGSKGYQPKQMSHLGILIGLVLIGLGIYVLVLK